MLYERDGAVATLTLSRPERLNAIVPELIDDLEAALDRAEKDAEIRVTRLMKLLVNQAYDQMGLPVTQLVGTLLDGAARHTPYGQERR